MVGMVAKTKYVLFPKLKDKNSAPGLMVCIYNAGLSNIARPCLKERKNWKMRKERKLEG